MDYQSQINELKRRLDMLESSSTFPRNVEKAIRTRIPQAEGAVISEGDTAAAGTGSVFIAGTPTSLTLPPFPSGKLTITVEGVDYKVYYE